MVQLKHIKEIAKKRNKKIGKDAIKKVVSLLNNKIDELMEKAARNADFSGRKVIKPEDIEEGS